MGGTVTADTTERQILLDLVAAIQKGNYPVSVGTVSDMITKITAGKAQITTVQNLEQDPQPGPAKAVVPRIGDTERTAACDLLARHFSEGRITQVEFDERSAKAIAALTQPELNALFYDMPKLEPLPDPAQRPKLTPREIQEQAAASVRRRDPLTSRLFVTGFALLGLAMCLLLLIRVVR